MEQLSFGRHITAAGDPLQGLDPGKLFAALRSPGQEVRDRILQLRTLRVLDPQLYREGKKDLPYFVCAVFHPPVRRMENFLSAGYLVIDLDHLGDQAIDVKTLRGSLKDDPQVMGYFTSPGGDGLKVLFRLSEPCRDAVLYRVAYQSFATGFARRYGVEGCLDGRTHDVTRACFVSFDPEAWYLEDPEPLRLEDFLPEGGLLPAESALRDIRKEWEQAVDSAMPPPPDQDVLQRIRQRLAPAGRPLLRRDVHVPLEVEEAVGMMERRLPDFEMRLQGSEPIQFGRKLRVEVPETRRWAELNLFYGKRGYTVVLTTKSGSHQATGELAAEILRRLLEGPESI